MKTNQSVIVWAQFIVIAFVILQGNDVFADEKVVEPKSVEQWEIVLTRSANQYRSVVEKHQQEELARVEAVDLHAHSEKIESIKKLGTTFEKEIDSAAKVLGDHRVILSNREELVDLYRMMQDYASAATQQRMAVGIRERLYGTEATNSMIALEKLASFLFLTGKLEETLEVRRAVYQKRKQVLGADHSQTRSSRCEYCIALMRTEKFNEGEKEFRALIAHENKLDPDTFRVSQYHIDLASYLQLQGKKSAARKEAELAWRGFTKSLGKNHGATQNALRMLNELGGTAK